MALSTGVHTELFANLERTDVDVRVDETVVDVYATSIAAADPIPTNDGVVLADLSRPADDVPEAVALAAPSRIQNVRVSFEDGIRIIGPSIDMQWGGAVQANADPAGAKTSGKLEARRGSFSLLGSEFDLQQGTVYLAGEDGVVPFVDVLATTSIDDVEITATIRGVASRPEFELSSVPSLPQSEIFTILVTGTTDTQGADSDEVQDKAAAILAAMSNGALQRQLGERLRVDKIGVGFGDTTEQPILSVGKNITRDVYAETEYHHNAPQFENRAQLEVEYEFAPRWSLETFFGDAAQGGVDVFWGFAFDTKPNAKR
jgi:translocation and assembly module TamB